LDAEKQRIAPASGGIKHEIKALVDSGIEIRLTQLSM
jgi:hypothetical protein